MDAYDRCLKKLDDINSKIGGQCDSIISDLREIRRYNRNTMLIFMVLWGIGLPATFLISAIWMAHSIVP